MFRSLATRNFRLFFIGQGLSQSGLWMQTVATAVVVLDLTDSGLALGLVVAAQWAPMLLLGPWAGVLADRADRRRIIRHAQIGGFLAASGMAYVVIAGHETIGLVFALTVAIGVVTALETPARIALAGDLVADEDVANAVGLNASVLTGSRVTGPIAAGLLIAGPGAGWCFAVHAISKLPQLWLVERLDPDAIRQAPTAPRNGRPVREGLAHIWRRHELRLPLLLMAIAALFAFNHNTVLPLMAERTFGGGPSTYTILFASMSLGSVGGALTIARRASVDLRYLALASAGMAVAYVALAMAPFTAAGVVLAIPVGFFYVLLGGGTNAILQANAAPELRGRVLAMLPILANGLSPLGGPLIGWLSDSVGVRSAVAICGIPCAVSGAIVVRLARDLKAGGSTALEALS